MTNDIVKNMISERSAELRGRLSGSFLLFAPLDMSDPDAMLLAAYALGQQDAAKEHADDLNALLSVL